MDEMSIQNEKLKAQISDNERRIAILEGRHKQAPSHRILDHTEVPMLADKINPADFERFEFYLSQEALTLATDEAIERGLLTKIQIGTK